MPRFKLWNYVKKNLGERYKLLMLKYITISILFLFISTSAKAICFFNCETKEKCRKYAKSVGGDEWQINDAYEYCMEREQNIKDFGKPLDDFIKQN